MNADSKLANNASLYFYFTEPDKFLIYSLNIVLSVYIHYVHAHIIAKFKKLITSFSQFKNILHLAESFSHAREILAIALIIEMVYFVYKI